jgi:nicotinamidase-related amidase
MSKISIQKLEPSRSVLLLVDFINPLDFEGAESIAPAALAAARRTAALRRQLTGQGVRTIYANDNYGHWSADFKELWQHCAKLRGIPGQMARMLAPTAKDFMLLKARHSAFYGTPLNLLLEQLHCKRLIVTGLAADSCVLFSAMDAFLRGYSLWVPGDCVAAEAGDDEASALRLMERVLKADVRPAEGAKPARQRKAAR